MNTIRTSTPTQSPVVNLLDHENTSTRHDHLALADAFLAELPHELYFSADDIGGGWHRLGKRVHGDSGRSLISIDQRKVAQWLLAFMAQRCPDVPITHSLITSVMGLLEIRAYGGGA